MSVTVKFSKKHPREYHKELLNNPPKGINYLFNKSSNKKSEHQLTNNITLKKKLAHFVLKSKLSNKIGIFIPNIFLKKDSHTYDTIHSFNRLCISNSPYILELENGTAFLHYQPEKINVFTKYIVKKFVLSDNLNAIVFNSQASMNSFGKLFPELYKLEKVKKKSKVIYPLVPINNMVSEKTIKDKIDRNNVTFLFISSTFDLKGGKELVNAFIKLKESFNNVELKIISKRKDIPKEFLDKISNNGSIELLESEFSRKDLYTDYYLNADVFVLPTFRDSFGLVILEAMKNGLPIISTDTFAIPEIVDETNGILLTNKFSFFNNDFSVNLKYWGDDFFEFVKKNYDHDLEKSIFDSMKILLNNEKREKMSLSSYKKANNCELSEKYIKDEWYKLLK